MTVPAPGGPVFSNARLIGKLRSGSGFSRNKRLPGGWTEKTAHCKVSHDFAHDVSIPRLVAALASLQGQILTVDDVGVPRRGIVSCGFVMGALWRTAHS
jgi:hypothetical protein